MEKEIFLNENEYNNILLNICKTFKCDKNQIEILDNLWGYTNLVFSFMYSGKKYVYRHPSIFSNSLINRGRESSMQLFADACGIDTTLISMDVNEGWRISEYIESKPLDYENKSDIMAAISTIRKLHENKSKVKWNFNVYDLVIDLKVKFDFEKSLKQYKIFNISKQIEQLYVLTNKDKIAHCNCHGDCRDSNFLFRQNSNPILIDWEFAGYADPGFDIGSFVASGVFDDKMVDMILKIYLNHEPNLVEMRHFYAFIAITSYAFFLLTEYYICCGKGKEEISTLQQLRLGYIKQYLSKALSLY